MQGVSKKPPTQIKSLNALKVYEKFVVKENTDRTRFLNELGVMQYYRDNGGRPDIHTCLSFNIDKQMIKSYRLDQLKLNYQERELSVFLKNGRTVSPTEWQQYHIFSQLLGALTHLNERGMKHGDVKLGNTVIDWGERTCSGLLQLIDFETTTQLGKMIGPPTFSPPKDSTINPDLWAFFHEMAVCFFQTDMQKRNENSLQNTYLLDLNKKLEAVTPEKLEKKILLKLIKDALVIQKVLTFNDVNACFDQIMKTIKQPLFEGRPITGLEDMYKRNINKLIKKKKDFKDCKISLEVMFENAIQAKTYLIRYKKQLEEYSFIQEFSSLSQLCMTEIDNQIKCLDDIIASCRRVHEKKTGKECCTASVVHLEDFFKEIEPVLKNIIHIPSEETLFDVTELHEPEHLFFENLNSQKKQLKLNMFTDFFSQLEKKDFVKACEALKHIAGLEEKKDLKLKLLLGIMKKKLESVKDELRKNSQNIRKRKRSDFSQKTMQTRMDVQIEWIKKVIFSLDTQCWLKCFNDNTLAALNKELKTIQDLNSEEMLVMFKEFDTQLDEENFVKAYEALKHIAGLEEKKDLRLKLLGIMKKKLESNKEKLADYLSETKRQNISDFSQKTVQYITVSLKDIQIESIGHVISLIDSDGKPTNNTDGKKPETLEEALKKMQLDVPVLKDLPPPPTFRKGPNE